MPDLEISSLLVFCGRDARKEPIQKADRPSQSLDFACSSDRNCGTADLAPVKGESGRGEESELCQALGSLDVDPTKSDRIYEHRLGRKQNQTS